MPSLEIDDLLNQPLLFFSLKFVIVMNEAVGMAGGSELASLMVCGKGLVFSEKYDMISI